MIDGKKAGFAISIAVLLALLCPVLAFASGAPSLSYQANSSNSSNVTNTTHVIQLSSDATQCYFIANFTANSTQNFNLAAIPVTITMDSIGPLSVNLTVNGAEYTMRPGQLQIFANQSGRIYTISLGAITYTTAEQSVNVNMCSVVSASTSSSIPATTTQPQLPPSAPPPSTTQKLIIGVLALAAVIFAILYFYERRKYDKIKR